MKKYTRKCKHYSCKFLCSNNTCLKEYCENPKVLRDEKAKLKTENKRLLKQIDKLKIDILLPF